MRWAFRKQPPARCNCPQRWPSYGPTNGSAAYLDTSVFVKLIATEPESDALRARLRRWPNRASATLLRTETVRALRRSGIDAFIGKARRLFSGIVLLRIVEPLLDWAGNLQPAQLRSLDAVHLAASQGFQGSISSRNRLSASPAPGGAPAARFRRRARAPRA
ncbi:MAG: type II toxin-antitoxin system VapC family toxin, partial [Actinomycetota bacterium]|nr:type II toxin-antitoxin system VapC family toxin [Actinomycetota bacterium]